MKAGTSSIMFSGRSVRSTASSSSSPTMLSDTRCAGSGQAAASASSSAGTSGLASGRIGNTVRRSAVIALWRSIIGE